MTAKTRAARQRRGAGVVYVEFLMAFPIVLLFFLSLMELGFLYAASLMLRHAAVRAARAASVVLYDNPTYYDNAGAGDLSGRRGEDILLAATLTMSGLSHVSNLRVTYPKSPSSNDDQTALGPEDIVHVRVQADYRCLLPLASRVVCDAMTGLRPMESTASLPVQGASYDALKREGSDN